MSVEHILANHVLTRTRDVDAAAPSLGKVFGPHDLGFGSSGVNVRLHSYQLRSLRLSYAAFGAVTRLNLIGGRSGYLVLMPLAGSLQLRSAGLRLRASPGTGVVLGPDESVSARCTEDCATLLVELERDALITHTRGLLNNSWAEPPRFRPIMRLDSDAANIWHDFLLFLLDKVDDVDHAEPALRQPLMAAELERALMTGLLIAQPNVHSAALTGKADAEPSSPAELASRMITDSPEAGHTVAGLAQAVGVSVRTLEKEFRRRFGIAPYTYLRQVRLARAHADLSELDSADKKVSEVAARWGFHHLGRFAREYRNKYDEYPSETAQHVRASKVR